MTEFDNLEENDELEGGIITLTDTESGEEKDFELYARCVLDEKLYYALVPAEEDSDEYVILRATEDGDDILFETIEDDEEFEKVEDYFNDLLFNEIDYDEN